MLNIAKAASQLSDIEQHKLGAVIAKGTEILAVGQNQAKSHPLQKKYNKFRGHAHAEEWSYLHAELSALVKIKNKKQLHGAKIYISRTNKSGKNALARPCAACFAAIKDFGISRVVYTTEHGYAEEFLTN